MPGTAIFAERQQALGVVAIDEGDHGDGAGLDHRAASPGEQQGNLRPPGQAQIMVFTALVRVRCAQLAVTQRADQHHQTADQPQRQVQLGAAGMLRHQRRQAEDADTDHHTDQHGHGIDDRKPGALGGR